MRNKLFVGNYDDAIFVIGGRGKSREEVTGKLAKKCIEVSPRAAHCVTEGGAAVLYEAPEDYLRYLESLYGVRARIFAPSRRPSTEPGRPLSLVESVLADGELVRRISAGGLERGWSLEPFIASQSVYELSRRTGLPVSGMSEAAIARGLVAELNSKKRFREVARVLSIPVLDSQVVRGLADSIEAVRAVCGRTGGAMLKQSHGASGLGNLRITKRDLALAGERDPAAVVEKAFASDPHWAADDLLVEEYLDFKLLESNVSVLMRIHDGNPYLVATVASAIRDDAFVGGVIPAPLPREVSDELVHHAYRYARWAADEGCAEGFIDVDFGILTDGRIVAFESNCRHSGNNHAISIRARLCPMNSAGMVSLSNDALPVDPRATLRDAIAYLNDRGEDGDKAPLAWDAKRGEGVVVAIPPAGGSMGYVALARTYRRAAFFESEMAKFTKRSSEGRDAYRQR